MTAFVIIVLVLLAIAVFGPKFVGTPEPYCSRSCSGRAWRRAFPNADKKQLRDFMQAFVDAFMFSSADRLRFLPSDAVMDVYRKATGPWVDNMELDFFVMNLKHQFGFDVEPCWHDQITLGEIFSHVAAAESDSRHV
jgi:propanediol dehydratase small subunit